MEILSDTVFRGGMQAKSVTVGNVNITSDSVVVPSLYANTLLLCGGSKSISDFTDITKYVEVGSGGSGSGGIFVCGSKSPFLTQTFEDVIVGNKRSNSDDNYPLMFRGFNTSGSTNCSYNIYSHCGFRTSWGIQLGFTEKDDGTGGGYIDLNGQRIKKWEDLSNYLNGSGSEFNGSGGSTSSSSSYGLCVVDTPIPIDVPCGCMLFANPHPPIFCGVGVESAYQPVVKHIQIFEKIQCNDLMDPLQYLETYDKFQLAIGADSGTLWIRKKTEFAMCSGCYFIRWIGIPNQS